MCHVRTSLVRYRYQLCHRYRYACQASLPACVPDPPITVLRYRYRFKVRLTGFQNSVRQNHRIGPQITGSSRGHSSGFQNSARQNPDGGEFHSREVHWWSCASACTKAGNKEPGTPNYLSHRVVRSRPAFTGRLQTLFSQVDSCHRSIA
jgi:hypothetical protein